MKRLVKAAMLLTLLTLSGCSEPGEDAKTPEEYARSVLDSRQEGEGVAVVEVKNGDLSVTWRDYPWKATKQALSYDASDFIEGVFGKFSDLHTVDLTIEYPSTDDYGNVSWSAVANFYLTRGTYQKIQWGTFSPSSLRKVADYGWIHPSLPDE